MTRVLFEQTVGVGTAAFEELLEKRDHLGPPTVTESFHPTLRAGPPLHRSLLHQVAQARAIMGGDNDPG
jgi:hypothetical protein